MIGLLMLAASTYFMSGNDLYEGVCGPRGERLGCAGYVAGALDAFSIADDAAGRQQPYCLSTSVIAGQLADVVKAYLANHPEKRAQTGAVIVLAAVHEAFPCPR